MKVIILAGGQGTRLPVSAKNIPKPLVKINNKTILDYQIEFLERFGFSDIRFSLGYQAEKIVAHLQKNYPHRYEWIIEPKRLGTGGALKFACRDLKEDFLALNIDDFPKLDLKDFVRFHQGHEIENSIAIYNVNDAREFGLVKHKNGIIEQFLEKPKEKKAGFVNTGFYLLSPRIFDGIPQNVFSLEKDLFPRLAKNRRLAAYQKVKHWFTVGTEERLKEAKKFFLLNPHP